MTCSGAWCFFDEPFRYLSPGTPRYYGKSWGFVDSSVVGPSGWSPIIPVPRGGKACPTEEVCLNLGELVQLVLRGGKSPRRRHHLDRGVSWAPVDLTMVDPPFENVCFPQFPDCIGPIPVAPFGPASCPSVTMCTATYWTGDLAIFSTTDGWATVDISRIPAPISDP